MIRNSRDGGGRPPIHLVSAGFSKQGCGHLLGPLIPSWEAVPPGLLWLQKGAGGNRDNSTMRETEGAELGPLNPASGGWHHAEVRATHNSCVQPPD